MCIAGNIITTTPKRMMPHDASLTFNDSQHGKLLEARVKSHLVSGERNQVRVGVHERHPSAEHMLSHPPMAAIMITAKTASNIMQTFGDCYT